MLRLTKHASLRCAQRGLKADFLSELMRLSDVETPVGSNCRLLQVSRSAGREHAYRDRLSRYGVIWSDDSQSVVTVMALHRGRNGRRYRPSYSRGTK